VVLRGTLDSNPEAPASRPLCIWRAGGRRRSGADIPVAGRAGGQALDVGERAQTRQARPTATSRRARLRWRRLPRAGGGN